MKNEDFVFQFSIKNWKLKIKNLFSIFNLESKLKFAKMSFSISILNWKLNGTFGARILMNPCMESMIQKISFLKNENGIFSFFNFWKINLNVIFRFFEIRISISIWVSIKTETKFEFMEFDCDVKELLSGW